MNHPKIDNASMGTVFAYDAETGEVIWTHEEIIETTCDQKQPPACVSQSDCDHIRATAAQIFPNRKIDTLVAPDDFTLQNNVRLTVDTNKKTLVQEKDEKHSLAERLAQFS